jgi:hypothetical protein
MVMKLTKDYIIEGEKVEKGVEVEVIKEQKDLWNIFLFRNGEWSQVNRYPDSKEEILSFEKSSYRLPGVGPHDVMVLRADQNPSDYIYNYDKLKADESSKGKKSKIKEGTETLVEVEYVGKNTFKFSIPGLRFDDFYFTSNYPSVLTDITSALKSVFGSNVSMTEVVDSLKFAMSTGKSGFPVYKSADIVYAGLSNAQGAFREFSKDNKLKIKESVYRFGFALTVGNEDLIKAFAEEDGIDVDWKIIDKDTMIIERNILNLMKKEWGTVFDQGHGSYDELIGSVTTEDTRVIRDLQDAVDDEPFSTSSGTFPFDQRDYEKGTSMKYDIDVTLEIFDEEILESRKKDFKKIKESLRANDKTVEAIIRAFEYDLEAEDVELCRGEETPYRYGLCFEAICSNNGESEWMVFADEADVEQEAYNTIKNKIESAPELFNSDWLREFTYISDVESESFIKEDVDIFLNDLMAKDVAKQASMEEDYSFAEELGDTVKMENVVREAKDKIRNKYYEIFKEKLDKHPIEYLAENGYHGKDLCTIPFVKIDYGKATNSFLESYGVSAFFENVGTVKKEIADPVTKKTFIAYGTN